MILKDMMINMEGLNLLTEAKMLEDKKTFTHNNKINSDWMPQEEVKSRINLNISNLGAI